MKNIEIVEQSHGLKCDNPNCNYTDSEHIPHTELENHIGRPCPKCGENLLTEEDCKNAVAFYNAIDFINTLSEDELLKLTKQMGLENKLTDMGLSAEDLIHATVDLHNGININLTKIESGGESTN